MMIHCGDSGETNDLIEDEHVSDSRRLQPWPRKALSLPVQSSVATFGQNLRVHKLSQC